VDPVRGAGGRAARIGAVLPLTADTFRLSLHVLAATIWVGGQFALAGLLPSLRALGDDAPRTVARAFNRLAWPAFAVLVATGIWNLVELPVGDLDTEWQITLFVKILVVAAAGVAAAVHAGVRSRAVVAATGAVSGLASITAVVLGIMLHG
jgi:putative copper export protein